MKTNLQFLHERAVKIAKTYLRAESDLIAVLKEIDECRGYLELRYKSLFDYAIQALNLSASVSYNLITIARKSKEVPELQEMIRTQEITVSNARMIAPVLNFENQDKWLSAAATLSKRELEKEIAKELPETLVQEKARYVSEKRMELKLGVSEAFYEKLKRVQDLVSSQEGRAANFENALEAALEIFIEKKDPIEKARRVEERSAKTEASTRSEPVPGQVNSKKRFIPSKLAHVVRLRDVGQCTFRSSQGVRCSQRRWLDIHHVRPLAEGGNTSYENLTLLCRGHHRLMHH